jgi:hypothetical protein
LSQIANDLKKLGGEKVGDREAQSPTREARMLPYQRDSPERARLPQGARRKNIRMDLRPTSNPAAAFSSSL